MSSDEQKEFRQRAGKKIIEYLSNLTTLDLLNKWALRDELVFRDPKVPVEAYKSITKSMTILKIINLEMIQVQVKRMILLKSRRMLK